MPADRTAVDANVLVYALYRDAPQHASSRAFLDRAQRTDLTLCLTSQTLAEFYSIVTSPKRVSAPRTPQGLLAQYNPFWRSRERQSSPCPPTSPHAGWTS